MRCWGTESDTPDLPLVLAECLEMSGSPNVVELHIPRLPGHHKQPPWPQMCHTGSSCPGSPVGSTHAEFTQPPLLMESSPLRLLPRDLVVELIKPGQIIVVVLRCLTHLTSDALAHNSVDTRRHAAVPKHHVTVLAPGDEHVAVSPRVDAHHVTHVPTRPGLHHLPGLTVSHEDLVLARSGGDKSLSSWDPGAVPDGAIVNAHSAGVQIPGLWRLVKASVSQPRHIGYLESLVIASCCQNSSVRGPT